MIKIKKLKGKLNQMLTDMAYHLPNSTSSNIFWGEIKMPECLRKELEEAASSKKEEHK